MKGLSAGLVALCLSLNVGWAAESKPPVAANQTMHDIQGSNAAQSQTGDAIAGNKVDVDKSTHIGQQTNYQLTPELIAEFAKSKQGMSEFERRLWWLGVGVISVFFSVALIAYFQFLFTDSAKQSTIELNSRQRFIHSLQTGIRRDIYRRGVSNFLTFLQRTYGGKMSWQAFNLSLLLAYVYPFLMFLLAYSYFGGTGDFSGVHWFPVNSPWRAALFPAVVLYASFFFFIFKYSDQCDAWGGNQFERLGLKPSVAKQLWRMLMGLGVAAIVKGLWPASSLFQIILVGIGGYMIGAFAFAGAFAVAGAVAVAVTVAVAVAVAGDYTISLLVAFFFLALPLLNALLDYLSWAVSRFFLEQTLTAPNIIIIALEIFADAILAVVFLLLFCVFLPAIGLGLDTLYSHWHNAKGISAQTNWRDYVVVAALYPWGKGLMITSMLFSTLLPTFLHLLLASSAIVIHALQGEKLAAFLQKYPPESKIHNLIASLWLYGYVLLALGLLIGFFWLATTLWHLPVAQWLYQFTYWLYADYGLPAPQELFGGGAV